MRCTIAGYSFNLIPSEVERALSGIDPEPVQGESVPAMIMSICS